MVRAEGADTPPITVNLTVKCPFVFTPSLTGSNQKEKVKSYLENKYVANTWHPNLCPCFRLLMEYKLRTRAW